MLEEKIVGLYHFYKEDVFPKVNHIRGTQFLKRNLKKACLRFTEKIDKKPISIHEKEWDNLIIIDACRKDLYQEVTGKNGSRTSLGSHTQEYIDRNFSKQKFEDIVYVAGNPHFAPSEFKRLTGKEPEKTFHKIYHTWNHGWSDYLGTCPADKIEKDAKKAKRENPDKKIIIHFMQPHYPFIGYEFGKKIDSKIDKELKGKKGIWYYGRKDILTDQELWKGYRKNLEYVLKYVENLVEFLEGKTVITSDHGNLVGEHNLYGHPKDNKAKLLRKVPWDVRKN